MKIKENFALSGWGNFKTKNCKLVIFDSFKELRYLIGKKDIIATINFQSMHIIVGLKIGVQVDESIT